MRNKSIFFHIVCSVLLAAGLLSGCTPKASSHPAAKQTPSVNTYLAGYEVTPETFALSLSDGEQSIIAAQGAEARRVALVQQNGEETTWQYPEEQLSVVVKPVDNYLSVAITATGAAEQTFSWPQVAAESYYLPLGEGKRIPAQDELWRTYLHEEEFAVLEQLSMPFWAAEYGQRAVVTILEEPFRSKLSFDGAGDLTFAVRHTYSAMSESPTKHLRLYLTDNDPVSIAKIYKAYVQETQGFVTLEEKAQDNPNIRKLYGAPFIYLWAENVLAPEDIHWPAFRQAVSSPVMDYLLSFEQAGREEFAQVLEELKKQDYVAAYQKETVLSYLSGLLKRGDFYDPAHLAQSTPELAALLATDYAGQNDVQKFRTNALALSANLPGVFEDTDEWLSADTVALIADLKESGLEKAWLGLNSWEQAYVKPELISLAADAGYLIGSYDSYHSIHQPGQEQWITAAFDNPALYEDATVVNKKGEKIQGFQGVGRKLNPTLSLPAVKTRLAQIFANELPFNAWFIDCDATGEIYDDYSPAHPTSQEADLQARLERMAYIRDAYQLVIGSEGGHDFAASTIAFAHGIELKSFSWMDEDMKANRDSAYYIGKYYSPTGGVAEHFAKRIPLKSRYYSLFVDPRYDAPLFRLVYNDSVITTYHWDWSTFKIKGATQDRMVREVLYNVPPLYHLDASQWAIYKDDIVRHNKVWSDFSQQVITEEMTDFAYLSDNGAIQRTEYGGRIQAIANFSDGSYLHDGQEIPAHSILIITPEGSSVYMPQVAPENA